MKKMLICSSCNKNIQTGATRFKCPGCGKNEIIRCGHCKKTAVKYKCNSCGFVGPN
ncbi:DUF1610 domain-containing protein [Candidatus Woesearchaeota archaeon]|nr:DUF1610 domain-containing protein [Candidatus Woesearchaeota archaeon]